MGGGLHPASKAVLKTLKEKRQLPKLGSTKYAIPKVKNRKKKQVAKGK